MAVNIPPKYAYIPQADAYPKPEWTWRGIVGPSTLPEPDPEPETEA